MQLECLQEAQCVVLVRKVQVHHHREAVVWLIAKPILNPFPEIVWPVPVSLELEIVSPEKEVVNPESEVVSTESLGPEVVCPEAASLGTASPGTASLEVVRDKLQTKNVFLIGCRSIGYIY